jgi:23S rRNA pseudouridine1911/1915/1917 synthase
MTDSSPPEENRFDEWAELQATEKEEGQRVDVFLAQRIPAVGRKLAALLCEKGDVLVAGRRAKKSHLLSAGSDVAVRLGAWGRAEPAPEIPLVVVLETSDLVVCEKPAGVPSAALLGHEKGTMAGALLARYPEMAGVGFGPREPGIVHRLDNDTSGLLLAARHQQAFLGLRDALRAGRFQKKYLALVPAGRLAEEAGVLTQRLMVDPGNRQRVVLAPNDKGYACKTEFTVRSRGTHYDLVEAQASAAFRHQVRVHFQSLGAPLIGDRVYGGDTESLPTRHALHASHIAAAASGVPGFSADSDLPADLRALLEG